MFLKNKSIPIKNLIKSYILWLILDSVSGQLFVNYWNQQKLKQTRSISEIYDHAKPKELDQTNCLIVIMILPLKSKRKNDIIKSHLFHRPLECL